jgi:hypothetical protein
MLADPVGLQHPALIVLLAELATLFSAERDELQDERIPGAGMLFQDSPDIKEATIEFVAPLLGCLVDTSPLQVDY